MFSSLSQSTKKQLRQENFLWAEEVQPLLGCRVSGTREHAGIRTMPRLGPASDFNPPLHLSLEVISPVDEKRHQTSTATSFG